METKKKMCFFETKKGILQSNFPQNALVCCNQGTISTLKVGDYAIYIDYVILGQFILANKCPDLDNYRKLGYI